MRLIDADALDYTRIQIFYGLHEDGKPLVGGYNAVVMSSAIRNAPTIDAVPVIRCRDCIYWQDNNGGYPHAECKWGSGETPDADDFCSCGERRNETDDT